MKAPGENRRARGTTKPAAAARAGSLWLLIQVTALLTFSLGVPANEILVPPGAVWRYSDTGAVAGVAWRAIDLNDTAWKSGPAILGYGDGDVATLVSYGPASTNKFITTYFRRAFTATNTARFHRLQLRLLRDDGAVVYLNGTEVLRDNLPSGTVTGTTRAPGVVGGGDERTYYPFAIGVENLMEGTNVLAVEVHQTSPTSSDVAFDLAVTGEWVPFNITPLVSGGNVGGTNGTIGLAVSVTDPALLSSNATVRFHLRAAGPPPGPDFTLVALPDTQYYTAAINGGKPAHFFAQTDWIVSNRLSRDVVFVTHLGDVVEHGDNGGTNVEWQVAADALHRLEDPVTTSLPDGIAYGIAVGNHDQSPDGSAEPRSQLYNQFFGIHHFASRPYYGGHYGTNNDNHYELFSGGDLRFVILHLEYNTQTNRDVLEWAGQVLRTHADRRAIVVGHYLVNTGNPGSFSQQGQRIYDALKGNTNLFLMLGGHAVGEGRRQDEFEGRTVHTLLADYQDRANGGNAWLRLLEFSPSNRVIRVRTYSPILNQYETDANSEFNLDCDLSQAGSFSFAGETSVAIPAPSASLACSNLTSATAYEWFVSVADGSRVQTGPIWSFTTGDIGESNAPPALGILAPDTLASEVGPVRVRFIITRSGRTDDELLANLEISGSASNAVDFAPLAYSVSLPPGTNVAVLTLVPLEDGIAEGFEDVTVTLLPGESHVLASNATATIWIADGQSDADHDGHSDGAEVITGTDPWDPASVLEVTVRIADGGELEFAWPCAPGRVYRVCIKDELENAAWIDLSDDIVSGSQTARWLTPMPAGIPHRFHAVRVVGFPPSW